MKRPGLEKKILVELRKQGRGRIYIASDFAHLGKIESINRYLSWLKDKNILVRLAQGIYLYPKLHESLGILYPPIDEIAQQIAKRDRATIIPTGPQALNLLGLTTQVPVIAVYLTNGSPRSIRLGKRSIQFKRTTPRYTSLKGEISTLVIQALRELGKENVEKHEIEKLRKILSNENPEHMAHDMRLAPAWIKEIMQPSIDKA